MRIATMLTGKFPIPVPTERIYAPAMIAQAIAEGLAARGHDVTFFAPEGSRLQTRIVSGGLAPLDGHPILREEGVRDIEVMKLEELWDHYLLSLLFAEARRGAFDLALIHPVDRALPFTSLVDIPVVFTLHDPIFPWRAEVFRLYRKPNQHYVSLSDAQRKPAPDLPYAATIPNGIPLEHYPFAEKAGTDAFVFVGRLLPVKGVSEAIRAAKLAGAKLIIVGRYPWGTYWEREIKPQLEPGKIEYAGGVPPNETAPFYQNAKATLIPIQWEEPFGLTMIESMACGTPVIAFRRGSVPEIVVDGVTGFIVDTVEEMAEAMKRVDEIDRRACREHVERNFTVEKMVDRYEALFLNLTQKRGEKAKRDRR